MIAEAVAPIPVEYLTTGDHALLLAWVQDGRDLPSAVLCLEDGSAVSAFITDIRFDYRWYEAKQQFVDVSGVGEEEESEGADTDQEPPDDGGQGVSGPVPEAD